MADNVAITAGSGTSIRTDDVGGVQYPVNKLDGGADGTTVPITADTTIAGLPVEARHRRVRVAVTPTISSGAIYAAKDAVGGIMSFASAVRATAGTGLLRHVAVVDKGQQMAGLDLVLFSATIAGTVTDNAVFAPTDADGTNFLGRVQITATTDYADFSTNSMCGKTVEIPIACAATTLFGALVARGTPTYTSTTDLVVTLTIDQD